MGSGPSREETDPALQNEAIIIEKNQKLREIEQLRQEIERLRMVNSNRNEQEDLAQRAVQLEENLSESRSDNLQLREQMDDLRFLLDQVARQEQPRNTSVLILGGYESVDTISLFDSKVQSWKKLSITLPMELFGFGAVVLNEEIYIFGEYANNDFKQDCYKLKDDGSWIKLALLNQKRPAISSSSLVYKGNIWIIGGNSGDSEEYLKSIEKYDISQDKWTFMPVGDFAGFLLLQ